MPVYKALLAGLLARLSGRELCRLCQLYPMTHGPVCEGCHTDLPWRRDRVHVQGVAIQVAHHYAWPIDRLIHLHKYQGRLELTPLLADGLRALERPDVDAVLAVPLSDRRLVERGFNQSHELAKVFAHHAQIALWTGVGRRAGMRQQGLSRSERLGNLDDAFALLHPDQPVPARILLIDDVLTTGTTLARLADFLRASGAVHVEAMVVASNQQQGDMPVAKLLAMP